MVDPALREIWQHRAIYVAVAAGLILLRLLPVNTTPGHLPGPDLLLCLTLAWVQRRPDYLPAGLVAAVILTEDLFMLRPPGLWAALTVLGTEFLRSRAALTRELSFLMEWLLIAAVMVVLFLAGRLAHAVMFLPQIGFGYATAQVLASILAYPLVVGLSRVALGVHKPGMGEVDARGRRF